MADENTEIDASRKKQKDRKRKKKKVKQLEKDTDIFNEPANKSAKTKSQDSNSKGRQFTVSVAIPGSILDNAQSPELRTYLAGQIARGAVIFNVDEIIVFNESGGSADQGQTTQGVFQGATKKTDANLLLARILQYLECPQYLRKNFFPKHPDLRYAGLLNPLDCTHHMRIDDDVSYREGVVLDRPVASGQGSLVNAGMRKDVRIDKHLKPGVRVTVKMNKEHGKDNFNGTVVPPSEPRMQSGVYWGYTVRLAKSFSAIFTQSPYEDGYDVTVGTSERGQPVDQLSLPKFRHLLIVFGGLQGLEASLESDETLQVPDPSLLFDHYVNTCTGQGSRTIRTEEALPITLSLMKPKIEAVQNWKYFCGF